MAGIVQPLHQRIGEELLRRMEQGELPLGARLAPEVELAREFGVSRQTIRAALSALARSGYLKRRRGAGTIVVRPQVEQRPHGCYHIERQGRGHSAPVITRVLARGRLQAADELAARAGAHLGIARPEDIGYLLRVRLAGGESWQLENIAFPADLCPMLLGEPPNIADGSVSVYAALLAHSGLRVTHAREVIRPALLTGYEARVLGVPVGLPAFQIERTSFAEARPVEWRQTLARGDRLTLSGELRDPSDTDAPA
jgi:DNA-binding GntR family transcriptional regulator